MELFPAADDETWNFIKSQIDDSDYYVVIVAGRYGSLAPDGLSFTEKEYDYALSKSKPVIGFIHGDPGSIPANKTDAIEPSKSKLALFSQKIKKRPVRQFLNPHTLALEVTISFVQLIRDRPAVGYVRTSEAVDYKRYAALLEENNALKEQLKLVEDGTAITIFPAHKKPLSLAVRPSTGRQEVVQCTVGTAFEAVGEAALQYMEQNEVLSDAARRILNRPLTEGIRLEFETGSLMALRRELVLYGLVEFTTEARSAFSAVNATTVTRTISVLKLTDYGRRQLSALANQNVD
jgi:uncharacterized protein DUF4062